MNLIDSIRDKTIRKQFTIYPETNNKLDNIAKKYKTSRSKVLEYLIVTNYENLMKKENKKEA